MQLCASQNMSFVTVVWSGVFYSTILCTSTQKQVSLCTIGLHLKKVRIILEPKLDIFMAVLFCL